MSDVETGKGFDIDNDYDCDTDVHRGKRALPAGPYSPLIF